MIGYPKTGLLATENDGLGFSMASMERYIYIYNMVFYDGGSLCFRFDCDLVSS